MPRRGFLKRDAKAGWPDIAVCMDRAARSSGVPFATLARVAKAARKALAECGRSTWSGKGSPNEFNDPLNWLYSRLPRPGDTTIFDSCSGNLAGTTNRNTMTLDIDRIIIGDQFKSKIGMQEVLEKASADFLRDVGVTADLTLNALGCSPSTIHETLIEWAIEPNPDDCGVMIRIRNMVRET